MKTTYPPQRDLVTLSLPPSHSFYLSTYPLFIDVLLEPPVDEHNLPAVEEAGDERERCSEQFSVVLIHLVPSVYGNLGNQLINQHT